MPEEPIINPIINNNQAIENNKPISNGAKQKNKFGRKNKKKKSLLNFVFALILWSFVAIISWVLIYLIIFPPVTYLMVQRAFEGDKINYQPVGMNKISRNLVDAAIAAEDAGFCRHNGFEFAAMERAMAANKRGRKLRGASTISQQTAKNAFLWPNRSYVRKAFEAGFTVLTEFIWPKRRIMATYLNVAEMGNGIFGAQAAARYYFGKDAKDLTIYEASKIAAILPNPQKYSVKKPSSYIARRANSIARGAITVRNSGLDKCIYK